MSTDFDGGNFRMDRVRIVCTDNGGDLFVGDFEWMEETNSVEVGHRSPGVAIERFLLRSSPCSSLQNLGAVSSCI